MTIYRYALVILWRLLNIIPLPVFILLLFAKKTDAKTTHSNQLEVQRYRLPKWARWAESPDEHLPGGLYEPTVKTIYDSLGWFFTSVYWIGWRNCGNGIVWGLGHEVPKKIKDMNETEQKLYGVWRTEKTLWKFKFIYGWETTRDWHSTKTKRGIWATPHFTIRLL